MRLLGCPAGRPPMPTPPCSGPTDPPEHVPAPGERNWRATIAGMRFAWSLTGRGELPQLAADQRRVAEYLASLPDPRMATDGELRASTTTELIDMFGSLFETHLVVSSGAGVLMTMLTQFCEQHLGDASIAMRLVSGLGDVDSAAPSSALWSLGRSVAGSPTLSAAFDAGVPGLLQRLQHDDSAVGFVAEFRSFLAEFGFARAERVGHRVRHLGDRSGPCARDRRSDAVDRCVPRPTHAAVAFGCGTTRARSRGPGSAAPPAAVAVPTGAALDPRPHAGQRAHEDHRREGHSRCPLAGSGTRSPSRRAIRR